MVFEEDIRFFLVSMFSVRWRSSPMVFKFFSYIYIRQHCILDIDQESLCKLLHNMQIWGYVPCIFHVSGRRQKQPFCIFICTSHMALQRKTRWKKRTITLKAHAKCANVFVEVRIFQFRYGVIILISSDYDPAKVLCQRKARVRKTIGNSKIVINTADG